MRKFILVFLVVNFCFTTYSQVIKGTVFDKKNGDVIPYASIYFNKTFVGTQSRINGNFELDISENKSMPLTISAIGYYSITLSDFSPNSPVIVNLEPKTYSVDEVIVSNKSLVKKRKSNLKVFKRYFLGLTFNAKSCEIGNEEDISFNYGSDHDTIKAFASKPLLIHNKAMGYKITFFLDKFEYVKKDRSFIYKGNIIFTEDMMDINSTNLDYEENRKRAYDGSRTHFFKALWSDNLESEGFILLNSEEEYVKYKDVVSTGFRYQDGAFINSKFIGYKEPLQINFFKMSTVFFLKDKCYFEKNGDYDLSALWWEGDMSERRVGDALPIK